MASHIYHPEIAEAGLSVECLRCAEIALRPTVGFDAANLAAYWQKMLDLKVHGYGSPDLTDRDIDACNYLYDVYVDLERLRAAGVIF